MRTTMGMRGAVLFLCAVAGCWAAASPAPDYRLIEAVKRRDLKAVAAALAQHADVNTALPDGATALSWAIFLDLPDIANKLLVAGAKVNSAGEYGETPLTLALANRNVPLVKTLLKAGADPKVTRWNGETALMIAAGAGSTEEVQLLLDAGLDVNATDGRKGQNALMWAAAEGHPDVVELLIQKGANVNAATKSGFTPLVFASMRNDADSVARLLKAGADPNYAMPASRGGNKPKAGDDGLGDDDAAIVAPPGGAANNGMKVLMVAESYHADDAASALLDGGANPNIADPRGRTPLHVAAEAGSLDLVKKLIAKGANLNVRTGKVAPAGPNAFRTVAGEQTPLLLAARNDHVDVMRALIEAGADTTLKDQEGATLLLSAAASGRVSAAKYAFEFDKDVNAKTNSGLTAMHECVSLGGGGATQTQLVEMVQYLADIGVPMDEVENRGRTPIQVGDGVPLDKPIQRMADIIISRGGTPKYFPKEYVKPVPASK